jgi:hypothetical protein
LSRALKQHLNQILSRRLGANYSYYLDNIFWLTAEKAVQFALALFVGAYVARFLGPDQYGLLGYAQGVGSMAGALVALDSMTSWSGNGRRSSKADDFSAGISPL